ncbi:2Fe-2S iron-sulfur cluster-binding protein [bacterium]|jgi:2Fe-2S ferredoxin|nr:2Fe-2S iron-sulfur cluster-binding protein [bacterium]
MPTIIFTTPAGEEHNVTVDNGVTVMEAGRDANLGIEGTCGGCLSCATCHVIVEPEWYEKTGGPSEDEEDMLDLAFGLTETSRLGCQLEMSDALDGLRLKIPEDM